VEDHGLGIPKDEQKHLFEPFWRGDEATARQIRGSGLGLALVRSVVRAHGGDVLVKSQPGAGSLFSVVLPAGDDLKETSGAREAEGHDDIAHPAG
jgi:signal transduction histidine kinase